MTPKPFYERSEAERIALTEMSIDHGTTVLERWTALAPVEADPWSVRSQIAARLLEGAKSVLDLGCGTMGLEKYIGAATYIPSDVTRRDDRTLVSDYNCDGAPQVEAEASAVLGVLEYLHDPALFLSQLPTERAVVSYCITDAPGAMQPRKAHAWVNDFSTDQVEAMFEFSRWTVETSEPVDQIQRIWLLRRSK